MSATAYLFLKQTCSKTSNTYTHVKPNHLVLKPYSTDENGNNEDEGEDNDENGVVK